MPKSGAALAQMQVLQGLSMLHLGSVPDRTVVLNGSSTPLSSPVDCRLQRPPVLLHAHGRPATLSGLLHDAPDATHAVARLVAGLLVADEQVERFAHVGPLRRTVDYTIFKRDAAASSLPPRPCQSAAADVNGAIPARRSSGIGSAR